MTTHLHQVLRPRMRGVIPPLPHKPSWRGDQLKHRDNFIFWIFLCVCYSERFLLKLEVPYRPLYPWAAQFSERVCKICYFIKTRPHLPRVVLTLQHMVLSPQNVTVTITTSVFTIALCRLESEKKCLAHTREVWGYREGIHIIRSQINQRATASKRDRENEL
jgi:hypothetical protein